jgi:hypothetical protein
MVAYTATHLFLQTPPPWTQKRRLFNPHPHTRPIEAVSISWPLGHTMWKKYKILWPECIGTCPAPTLSFPGVWENLPFRVRHREGEVEWKGGRDQNNFRIVAWRSAYQPLMMNMSVHAQAAAFLFQKGQKTQGEWECTGMQCAPERYIWKKDMNISNVRMRVFARVSSALALHRPDFFFGREGKKKKKATDLKKKECLYEIHTH